MAIDVSYRRAVDQAVRALYPGYFALVMATGIVSNLWLRGHAEAALVLWLFALALWVVLSYFSFAVLTFVNTRESADVVHGGWLIAIVGTESLALLGARVAPELGSLQDLAFVVVYSMWSIGMPPGS
jgi:tellurite resistance protein TehA-like permease